MSFLKALHAKLRKILRRRQDSVSQRAEKSPSLLAEKVDPGLSSAALRELIGLNILTEVVDVGSNPIDSPPPYRSLLDAKLCRITGFEPHPAAYEKLVASASSNESYLPLALGDGNIQKLRICAASGMSSILPPSGSGMSLFPFFRSISTVKQEISLQTSRLDEIEDVARIDFLKLDTQGSELTILKNAVEKLKDVVVIQLEVSFVPLYGGQPTFGEVDVFLRKHGFIPHMFEAIKKWPISPFSKAKERAAINQLLEADVVYIRDVANSSTISDEQLRHLALISHGSYKSYDLASLCCEILESRGLLPADTTKRYIEAVAPTQR